jgi:hypothetical protein
MKWGFRSPMPAKRLRIRQDRMHNSCNENTGIKELIRHTHRWRNLYFEIKPDSSVVQILEDSCLITIGPCAPERHFSAIPGRVYNLSRHDPKKKERTKERDKRNAY